MKNKNSSLALLGAGYWGKNLARNFDQLGELHTISEKSEYLINSLKANYPNVNFTENNNDIYENPEITKVAIAAPAAMHFELAKKCLEANKDVFVEKPLCLEVEQGEELVELAEKNKRILMVGHLLQYHPCINYIQDSIKSGKLGDLLYISSNRLNLGKIRKEENALWSFAPHDISVILSLTTNTIPKALNCLGGNYINKDVADTTMTVVAFENNIMAHIYVSWINPIKEQKLTVIGSKGMIVFDDTQKWDNKLKLFENNIIIKNNKDPILSKNNGIYVNIQEDEPLKLECKHFIECCDKKVTPTTCGREGLKVLKLLHAAQTSLESKGELVTKIF